MPDAVRQRVIAIIAEQALLDPSDVRDEHGLADLGIDSMGVVEVVFAIEEAFDVRVPFNANDPGAGAFDISSVGAVVRAVEALAASRGQVGGVAEAAPGA